MKTVLDLEWYLRLRRLIIQAGYLHEITWSQSIKPVSNAAQFAEEFAFVVCNSGMKNTVARPIWEKIIPVLYAGGSASEVFGHKGKTAAIDQVWRERHRLLRCYLACDDALKLDWLASLPWIGDITKYHLAKNFGHDCAKPDRHLVRIAGEEGTHALCARLAAGSGDRIATVDLVIWRAASIGLA